MRPSGVKRKSHPKRSDFTLSINLPNELPAPVVAPAGSASSAGRDSRRGAGLTVFLYAQCAATPFPPSDPCLRYGSGLQQGNAVRPIIEVCKD